jgi:protein-L-isoaspartate O-methyltransferase
MPYADPTISFHFSTADTAIAGNPFESAYLTCRSRENRMYADEIVRQLPDCAESHPHTHEWQIRKRSCEKLLACLYTKQQPLRILEIGCGNGWLCHRLSVLPGSCITGMDVNATELQQAARVFHDRENIAFRHADAGQGLPDSPPYDIILFAASMQYFRQPADILERCMKQLAQDGEIHIIDTHFYPTKVMAAAARERSHQYYQQIGSPEMQEYYFHHAIGSLAPFRYVLRYNPLSLRNRLSAKQHPFHWIIITKNNRYV